MGYVLHSVNVSCEMRNSAHKQTAGFDIMVNCIFFFVDIFSLRASFQSLDYIETYSLVIYAEMHHRLLKCCYCSFIIQGF